MKQIKLIIILFILPIISILFLLNLASCSTNTSIIPSPITISSITISTARGAVIVNVEIADSKEEQASGLMYRTSLDTNKGMLFIFNDEQQRIFWMKNTKIPLDIIFIDANNNIVDIKEDFQPCTAAELCEKYISTPAQYALEVNAGFVKEYGVSIWDDVDFSDGQKY